MFDTMSRWLTSVPDAISRQAIRRVVEPSINALSSQALVSSGLVINGAGAAFAKTGATPFYATAGGKLVTLAAGTAMPALTGVTIPAGSFAMVCFFVDAAGNLTMLQGTVAATMIAAGWPQFPVGKALVGFLLITSGSVFTGGTTALDAATTVYLSPIGGFDPTALVA